MEERRVPMLSSSFTLKSRESIRLASSVSLKSGESFIRLGSEGLLISDFEDPSLESSPITFKVVFSSLVAVCGSYVYGHAYSVFSSILTVGAMLGAVISGRVADFVGRRAAMGISQLFCIFGWLSIMLAENSLWLDIGRFVLGCGIGLVSYAVPIYVAEITPRNVRGTFTALNPIVTTTLGLILIDRSGRRPMLLVSTVGACVGCVITAMAFVFKVWTYTKIV
ncbi:hypothetical protein LWI29_019051 [Acer saccharum]|uniref:Major facilitator superfamily (MFS) profile domain-containing protein n=1 Tax=Acer saccharum TaxID=4024 RepID=A0AA39T4D7_ACESA|nr:hypothetical protein LWI29_019051 [Acer saccharum]